MTIAAPRTLFAPSESQPVVEAFAEAGVPFIVIGGVAVSYHYPDRVPDDLDLVVARTEDAGKRLLAALAAIGTPGQFTPEDYVRNTPRPLGFPLKPPRTAQFMTDLFRAETWFNFEERQAEAHDALLFDRPVKVASKAALILWNEPAQDLKPKHLRDLDLLRGHSA